MPYLIGCSFTPNQGWRVRKCLLAPVSLATKYVAHRDNLLWVVADSLKPAGQYINPAKIITDRLRERNQHV